jgi:hypothetical protein
MIMNEKTEWLWKSDEPWTRYRTGKDLLGLPGNNADVQQAYLALREHPLVMILIEKGLGWGSEPFKRHNDAAYPIYAISALADFGLDRSDERIARIAGSVLEHVSDDGGLLTKVNIPKTFGGSGEDVWTWIICDMPTLLYSLLCFGYQDEPAVKRAIALLEGLAEDNGWRCSCHPGLGKFRGPGGKTHPCPVVNVFALKALSCIPRLKDSPAAALGIEMLLNHWEKRKEIKYYLFGIGTEFRKIKYPYVWYNILHVLEVLSRFPLARSDSRYLEMLSELKAQADPDGRYTASSMYRSWNGWSFADKKTPSPWLTFLAERIAMRSADKVKN